MEAFKTVAEETAEKRAKERARRETLALGKSALGTDRFGRITSKRAVENLDNLQEAAVRGLEQNRGRRGIASQEEAESSEYKEDRERRSEQNSTNRRLIREINRAKQYGRVSSWLQRYSAQKEAEFNSQNAVLQSLPPAHGSVSYDRFGSDETSSSSSRSGSSPSFSSSLPSPPRGGTYVLGSVNGAIQWVGTSNC